MGRYFAASLLAGQAFRRVREESRGGCGSRGGEAVRRPQFPGPPGRARGVGASA